LYIFIPKILIYIFLGGLRVGSFGIFCVHQTGIVKSEAIACAWRCQSSRLTGWGDKERIIGKNGGPRRRGTSGSWPPPPTTPQKNLPPKGLPDSIFSYQYFQFWYILGGLGVANFGACYSLLVKFHECLVYLVCIVVIWYVLWSFGMYCGRLVCIVVIWYILWCILQLWRHNAPPGWIYVGMGNSYQAVSYGLVLLCNVLFFGQFIVHCEDLKEVDTNLTNLMQRRKIF
jgi:hypothetical protein